MREAIGKELGTPIEIPRLGIGHGNTVGRQYATADNLTQHELVVATGMASCHTALDPGHGILKHRGPRIRRVPPLPCQLVNRPPRLRSEVARQLQLAMTQDVDREGAARGEKTCTTHAKG